MNPALMAPRWSVYILSDGSIGETVVPMRRHCTMCAIISRLRVTRAAARQRLVFESFISLCWVGEFGRTGSLIDRDFFTSLLTQPLFMSLIVRGFPIGCKVGILNRT